MSQVSGATPTDTASIDEFVAARGHSLVRFAFLLTGGDGHRSEDLVQSALAKVLSRWPRICAGGRPEAYMHRVIVSEYLSWRRRRSSGEVALAAIPDHAAADAYALADARDAAWRLISTLPKRQRAVLVLRYLEDWSDEQIATAIGCSQATVRSQSSRALGTLRQRLGQNWTTTVGGEEHA